MSQEQVHYSEPPARYLVEEVCGCRWNGVQTTITGRQLALFTDPVTHSTLSLPLEHVTINAVLDKLEYVRKRFREGVMGVLVGVCLLLAGCSPAPQAHAQIPRPTGHGPTNTWNMVPMTKGPAVYWACVRGDTIYGVSKTPWRANEGPGGQEISLTVVPGGCQRPVARQGQTLLAEDR